MKNSKRIVTFLLCFVMACFSISLPMVASATVADAFEYGRDTLSKWMTGFSFSEPLGGWTVSGWADALFASNKEQKYYTTPTESTQDKYGNVTNYYRGGDTTTTKIIDSYNKTFNTINNTTNNTNNYSANVKLSDFLNSYTTYNNNYTYSTQLKSWYYDNTQNTYNYDASQTYYNTDNSKYYISIDNSTDEYYLIDVQYSPTFVTVNYTYNEAAENESASSDVSGGSQVDLSSDNKYPLGSFIDEEGNVYSPEGELLSSGSQPIPYLDTIGSLLDEVPDPSDENTADTEELGAHIYRVVDLRSDAVVLPVSEDGLSDGISSLKALVLSIFGEYTPVTTTSTILETVDGETTTTLIDVVASGAAGVDYAWISGVFLFGILLFCLMKLLGGILK